MTAAVGGDYGSGAAHTAGPSNYHTGSKGHRIEFLQAAQRYPQGSICWIRPFFISCPSRKMEQLNHKGISHPGLAQPQPHRGFAQISPAAPIIRTAY
jgi:hypothetical protein